MFSKTPEKLVDITTLSAFRIVFKSGDKILCFKYKGSIVGLKIPYGVKVCKKNGKILLKSFSMDVLSDTYKKIIGLGNQSYTKKLRLQGLGFKCSIDKKLNKLIFKIGYSHPVIFTIPEGIDVRFKKGTLFFKGNNLELLGNFMYRVYNSKAPDIYKGKGFWYKYQIKKLKEIKKK